MNSLLPPQSVVSLPILDRLLPMHVGVCKRGIIRHAGPTLTKMAGRDVVGESVFEVLSVRRPVGVADMARLLASEEKRLIVALKNSPDIALRATVAPTPVTGGAILDVSLGLSFVTAVTEFKLTMQDFSPSDQTVELMYLHEANTSSARLSRSLTERLQALHAAAERMATTDPLTGLANRRAMDQSLDKFLIDTRRDFVALQLDLDNFKEVNDEYGHAAGDAVLIEVGRILDRQTRRNDRPGRIGGDEFLILLRGVEDFNDARKTAARLIREIEKPIPFGEVEFRISASIGIAGTTQYAERPSATRFMADVDVALYQAKRSGRGRAVVFGSEIVEGHKV